MFFHGRQLLKLGFVDFLQYSNLLLEFGLGAAGVHSDFFDRLPGSLS
jgi:hypothetical protein